MKTIFVCIEINSFVILLKPFCIHGSNGFTTLSSKFLIKRLANEFKKIRLFAAFRIIYFSRLI